MIVFFRVLLLAAAAAAVAAGAVIGLRDHAGQAGGFRYACPMHPEVRAGQAGVCPICGMALEPVGRPPGATKMTGAEMSAAADLAAVDNVRKHNVVDFVRKRSLLPPMRELRGAAQIEADGTIAALFYQDQVEALGAADEGTFSPTAAPQVTVGIRRTAAAPTPWDRSTSWVRFRPIDVPLAKSLSSRAASEALRAGVAGWVELAPRARQVLAVPASAVLQSPDGPYVLAWTGGGFRFAKKPIEIGETFLKPGMAVVLAGLQVNDRVISRATFFLDADRRLEDRSDEAGWVTP